MKQTRIFTVGTLFQVSSLVRIMIFSNDTYVWHCHIWAQLYFTSSRYTLRDRTDFRTKDLALTAH
jgi:hypothetical protein